MLRSRSRLIVSRKTFGADGSTMENRDSSLMQSHVLRISLAASYLVLSLSVRAGETFSVDSAGGRLPKNVLPVSYSIDIAPDVDTMTIKGKESVELQFRAATD